METNPRGGGAFDDPDVAAAYIHRPPYPEPLFTFLRDLPRHRRRALDLGCGPGKLAHRLAETFDEVDAVDPSLPMLRLADDGRHANVRWLHGFAETAPLAEHYDLITAGASIHWMVHATLFPRLATILDPHGAIAIINGDDAHDPPWRTAWQTFLARWIARLGGAYDPTGYRAQMTAYRDWLVIHGERAFEGIHRQSVGHFIESQHSRATWSRANLGPELSVEFDEELRELLASYAVDGMVKYGTREEVVWGVVGSKQ